MQYVSALIVSPLLKNEVWKISPVPKQLPLSPSDDGLISACVLWPHQHPVIVQINDNYHTRSTFHCMSLLYSKTGSFCSRRSEKCKLLVNFSGFVHSGCEFTRKPLILFLTLPNVCKWWENVK